MTKAQVQTLPLGLYRIFWKSGGSSLASVGMDYYGTRWFAPCNWIGFKIKEQGDGIFKSTCIKSAWSHVKKVELIEQV